MSSVQFSQALSVMPAITPSSSRFYPAPEMGGRTCVSIHLYLEPKLDLVGNGQIDTPVIPGPTTYLVETQTQIPTCTNPHAVETRKV